MNRKIWHSLMNLVDNTAYFEILSKKNFKQTPSLITKLEEDSFPNTIIDFYKTMNGFQLKWRYNESLSGGVNFLAAEHLYDSTRINLKNEEIDWFIDNNSVELDGFFYPIEFITNEAQIGFFDKFKSNQLFYYESGASFYSLNINIEGYCQLLDHTFGLDLWPRFLLGLRNISFQSDVEHFVKSLSKINPKFSVDVFKKVYNENQIDPQQ